MATEINCKAIADAWLKETAKRVERFKFRYGRAPKLVTIIANDDAASERYVRNKMRDCERVGIEHDEKYYQHPTQTELEMALQMRSFSSYVDGVMLQLPVFDYLDEKQLIENIDPVKDVDCLTAQNMGKLALGDNSFMPATVAGIMRLFKEEHYDLTGKTVVIRGRSNIVGKPLALAMINVGATVVSKNSHSSDYSVVENYPYNIIVDATGKPQTGYVQISDYYIDVTTIVDDDGKLRGSMTNYDKLWNGTKYTPVPRGVGLLTRAGLCSNIMVLAEKRAE